MTRFDGQTITQTWDGYVNQSAQEFMDLSRQGEEPGFTSAEAVGEYVGHYNEMLSSQEDWLTADDMTELISRLNTYLDSTYGEEWT